MKDLKIRVNSEAESKEVQDFAKSDGYSRKYNNFTLHKGWVCLNSEKDILCVCHSQAGNELDDYKEITLPQLRDLVVLKRNDRKDANVSDENCPYDLYLTKSKELYFYGFGKNKWILSKLNGDDIYYESLKPIEKTEMKEYLIKSGDGKYLLTHHDSIGAIEIPEGANFAWKSDGKYVFFTALEMGYRDAIVVWNRHTLPEELPFIDDEPLQSLNDQYAEIEKVRQTLNQRQEQYGSFEDVAMITEQMVDVMRKGYYENLAYNQKMALYMICSKMARIVNGNPNHKDSWHDIAGYATLIDNELVSEKDMPF